MIIFSHWSWLFVCLAVHLYTESYAFIHSFTLLTHKHSNTLKERERVKVREKERERKLYPNTTKRHWFAWSNKLCLSVFYYLSGIIIIFFFTFQPGNYLTYGISKTWIPVSYSYHHLRSITRLIYISSYIFTLMASHLFIRFASIIIFLVLFFSSKNIKPHQIHSTTEFYSNKSQILEI